ncbi:BTB and MATH domain-containing protein 42 [Orchesella cincta]|uniref:BTB and MATH domain-containing protein 42 n=1 Tax=Orchesella cincta TaxID=48709 RepID=A0A1D2NLE7_ORCCI|nr:BTB and MATH domain-containing protein 42 [Orchesella cincta]
MDFNRGLPVTGPVRAQMEGQSRNNPAVVMSPQPSTSNLAVLAQPQISEGVCEHSVYIWELKESTFPAAVVPNERILDPIREPSRDTSSSIFDFHRLLDSGVFIRGQEVQKPAEWKLQLGMKQSQNNQTDQELQITLVCMKCYIPDAVPIWTKFSFEIIDEDGQALYTTGCIYDAELRHFLPGMSSSISLGTKTELQAKRDEYIRDGSLRFRLRLNIYQELLVAAAPTDNERELYIPASKRSRQELPSLLGTLEDLWNSRETSGDITIRCGDQNIKAHKFILSARSKVFAGMFDKETKELQTNIIEVEDVSLDDMLYLLEFMYLGDLNRFEWTSVDQICTLVYVADKYWIVPLMIKCFQNLMKLMDLENFGKIARVTFTYDCEKEFKDEVRHFYER